MFINVILVNKQTKKQYVTNVKCLINYKVESCEETLDKIRFRPEILNIYYLYQQINYYKKKMFT